MNKTGDFPLLILVFLTDVSLSELALAELT